MNILCLSDQELILRYQSGNHAALEVLIKRHKEKVFTAIIILVRNRALAEDIFQDTFIKVINTLRTGGYREQGKFIAWVLRIAHNLSIDHFRKISKMRMDRDTEEGSVFDRISTKGNSPYVQLVKKEIHEELRKRIEELPFEQKEVLILRHFADMNFKEIAELTNVSINTALGRMRYAILGLRKSLKNSKIENI